MLGGRHAALLLRRSPGPSLTGDGVGRSFERGLGRAGMGGVPGWWALSRIHTQNPTQRCTVGLPPDAHGGWGGVPRPRRWPRPPTPPCHVVYTICLGGFGRDRGGRPAADRQ